MPKWQADGLARVEKEAAESTGEVIDRYCREHGDERAAQVQSRGSRAVEQARSRCCSRTGCGHQQPAAIGEKLQLDVAEPSRRAGDLDACARVGAGVGAHGLRQNTPRGRWSSPPDTL